MNIGIKNPNVKYAVERSMTRGIVCIGIFCCEAGTENGEVGNQSGDFGEDVRKIEYGKGSSAVYIYGCRVGTTAGRDHPQVFRTGME